jgi:hypothetical protein
MTRAIIIQINTTAKADKAKPARGHPQVVEAFAQKERPRTHTTGAELVKLCEGTSGVRVWFQLERAQRNHNVFDVDQCANCDSVVGIISCTSVREDAVIFLS